MSTNTPVDVEALRRAAEAATPGPWQWRYYGNREGPDLVAAHSGMLYVMGFVRKGMNNAEPVFAERQKRDGRWTAGLMRKFTEWWKRDEKLAPDAVFIATADPLTVLALLDERDQLIVALGAMVDDPIVTTRECDQWWCDSHNCRNRGSYWATRQEIEHAEGCPVPAAERVLAEIDGQAVQ